MGRRVLLVPVPVKVMYYLGKVAEMTLQPPPFSSDQMLMMWRENVCGLEEEELADGVKALTGKEPEEYEEALRWSVETYLSFSP
jgi:NADH dehydrogenase